MPLCVAMIGLLCLSSGEGSISKRQSAFTVHEVYRGSGYRVERLRSHAFYQRDRRHYTALCAQRGCLEAKITKAACAVTLEFAARSDKFDGDRYVVAADTRPGLLKGLQETFINGRPGKDSSQRSLLSLAGTPGRCVQ